MLRDYWFYILLVTSWLAGAASFSEGAVFKRIAGVLIQNVLIFGSVGVLIYLFFKHGWRWGVLAFFVAWVFVTLGGAVMTRSIRRGHSR